MKLSCGMRMLFCCHVKHWQKFFLCMLMVLSGPISAQEYPNRPVRIFGHGPGSTADYLSRVIAQKLSEKWGQPVIVDNRAGAGGTVPADIVAKAPADGYSLLMGHAGPMVSAVVLYPNLPYDPVKDLAGVSMVATGVTVMMVHPSIPANTVAEFIQYAKKRNDLNFSSAGNGTISHLTGELFKQVTGVNMMHIPYKSAGAGLTALLANETQVSFLSPVTAAAQLKTGKLKALVVSTNDRFPGLPEVPSASEAGLTGMDAKLWFGLFTAAKTPKAVIQKLNQDITEILRRPDVKELFLKQGIQASASTPESLEDFVKTEIKRWTPIIKNANIQAD
ncbi:MULTISPECIES: tripartite tricarboxylate transporter substrate binding protein [unclassified Polynucleobacter]|uniref:Bug family tripartite tricarboxylate transporter substrate binding protein n=1 Tax=unclassified Polynucleobacter TaxID=2640945 RepID=UPI00248F9F8E|nr:MULTISPECIES: tripartite tricarboxylate transporter substrate binding protein [unclassified Polynucleobacter]